MSYSEYKLIKSQYIKLKKMKGGNVISDPSELDKRHILNQEIEFYIDKTYDYFEKHIDLREALDHLKEYNTILSNSTDVVKDYVTIMEKIKLITGGNINWDHLPKEPKQIKKLYNYRQVIIAISLIATNRIANSGKTEIIIIAKPRKLYKENAIVDIPGSTTLLSDVDITIDCLHTSMYISLIEDLWAKTNFDHDAYKVDLYGDFILFDEYYMDTNVLSKDVLREMLILAVVSYYRHPHSQSFDTVVLKKLVDYDIKLEDFSVSSDGIMIAARAVAKTIDQKDREKYYVQLSKAEAQEQTLVDMIKSKQNKEALSQQLGRVVIELDKANMYRNGIIS